jgi:hypothetical protein
MLNVRLTLLILKRLSLLALALLFTLPFFIPNQSSGSLSYKEAAGADATFLAVNHVNVHYQQLEYSGDCHCKAPLIVMLHGFGASDFTWRDIAAPLTKFGRVVAFERPAYGFTERPTTWTGENPYGDAFIMKIITRVIHRFGGDRKVVLLGHSAGANLAAQYALQNPTRVHSLVLMAPAILVAGGLPDWAKPFAYVPQIAHLAPALVRQIAHYGDSIIRASFYDQKVVTPAVLAGYHKPLQIKGWEAALWQATLAPRNSDLKTRLSEIQQPTLLITGDQDSIVPTWQTRKLSHLLPNNQIVVVPRAGHLAHEEYPSSVLSAIAKRAGYLF